MWAARYRRSVLLLDAGEPRNAGVDAMHGYLGLDGASPEQFTSRAFTDLAQYPEATTRRDVRVCDVASAEGAFELSLDDGTLARALRLVLCTGVRDLLPDIDGFSRFFGTSAFTCPSCDGYEAKGRRAVVIGDDGTHMAPFALGLLDWAGSVTVVVGEEPNLESGQRSALSAHGIDVIDGRPTAFIGRDGMLEAIRIEADRDLPADVVFCTVGHEQRSDIARRLGCEISDEGCVLVDDHCQTSVEHVFAAGDMTPGPHLVQVAAAKGATAGIAAALSLRGSQGAPTSSSPAPDPDEVLTDSVTST
jgi:thioredoxin reductase